MRKLRAYFVHNLDGRVEALIAAHNLTDAASKLITSTYDIRRYGWSYATGDDAILALGNPDKWYARPIGKHQSAWQAKL